MASDLFKVPIAVISLVDISREWYKSCQGLTKKEQPRSISFCQYTIMNDKPFIINDTLKDKRFRNNPAVVKKPKIRFYAGVPLIAPNGNRIGALCIKDTKPRKMSKTELQYLISMGRWAMFEIIVRQLSTDLINTRFRKWCLENEKK